MVVKHTQARFCFSLFLCLAFFCSLNAQVRFTCDAPKQVVAGEQFQVRFILDGANGTNFTPPKYSDLSVLFPPENAVSIANVNGHVSTTYTGTFLARAKGKVTISPASIVANGKHYTTRPVVITVLPQEAGSTRGNKGALSASNRAANEELFILAIPSKTTVYEHEALRLSFKLYSHSSRIQFEEAKFPEYDGFIEEEIKQGEVPQLVIEHYKGKNYFTAVIREVLIYPQHSGSLTIPQGDFGLIVAVEEDFDTPEKFFSQSSVPTVRRRVISPAVNINVKPLPDGAPKGFTNAVGSNFSIDLASPKGTPEKTGVPGSVKLTIKGIGNMKLLSMPKVTFPESFDCYDPVTNSDINISQNGASGSKTDTYQYIAHNTGTYTLPEIIFSYFDPNDKAYHTIKSSPLSLRVEPGVAEKGSKEDGTLLGNDIAPWKKMRGGYDGTVYRFLASPIWYILFLLILFAGGACYILFLRHRKRSADTPFNRKRKAYSNAIVELRRIESQIVAVADLDALYELTAKAIYQFIADLFMLPLGTLNKNSLLSIDAPEQPCKVLSEVISIVEERRYSRDSSPSYGAEELRQLISRCTQAMQQIANEKKAL